MSEHDALPHSFNTFAYSSNKCYTVVMNNNDQSYEKEYFENINHSDMAALYQSFEQHLPSHATLLDIGSGSGRDAQHFIQRGYRVTSFDTSDAMVEFSHSFMPDVQLSTYASFQSNELYDGLWACTSFIHISRRDIIKIIHKYIALMKPQGIFFLSFKSSDYDYIKQGEQYTCFTIESMTEFLRPLKEVNIIELFETLDGRKNHLEKWINVIIKKV